MKLGISRIALLTLLQVKDKRFMSLPTKQEIRALEDELGFPLRTAFRTHEDDDTDESPGNDQYYHFTIMPADARIYG